MIIEPVERIDTTGQIEHISTARTYTEKVIYIHAHKAIQDTEYKLTKIRDDKPFRTDFLGKKRKRK